MAEIGISVAAKVAEFLFAPMLRSATRQAQYLFCAGVIERNLQSTMVELTSKQENVKKKKQEALTRTEIIDDAVEMWLSEVRTVMEVVEQLKEDVNEGSSCCWRWCFTLKGYHLCKQFANMTETMKQLNQKGEFNPFSHPTPIPDIEFFSSGNFMYFESTKLASEQLLEALRDDSIYVIGLYGMGGCGKTTLAIEVGKKAKELKLFDHVVFTTVSQNVNVRDIQGEIADLLDFKLKSETKAGRARELSLRLRSGEQILIILDDVWAKLELEDIGIPLHSKGCKVLLATRRQQVCACMDCERKVLLSLLSDKEAWNLFQKNTHIVDESVAQEIVKECKGLPIAIVAVARSLKGRSLDRWNVALHKLRTSKPIDVEENEINAYSCLELSYNYLRSEEAKLLLKICCMFPDDHKIPPEELFRYGIGQGICANVDSFEVARSTVNVAIDDLVDSCLLLSENYKQDKFFKTHDMVRDVCLWIASKEDGTIMVDPERDFNAFVKNGSIRNCYALSLWRKNIDQFPQYLVAPKLSILLLHSGQQLDFSHVSFEGMKELRVISMINDTFKLYGGFFSLPLPTQWFNNLHTLRLVKQKIGDISFVVSLRKLKILDLKYSVLKQLPNGIENMNELKLMDLSNCEIKEECYEVIGRCSQLAELYIIFDIILPYKCILYNSFPRLQRYCLDIGNNTFRQYSLFERHSARELRAVRFGDLNISNSAATIKDLLQRGGSICLDGLVGGCKNIIPEFVEAVGTMNELTKLYLYSCSEVECIIDTTASGHASSFGVDVVLPMLVLLELKNMVNLKELIHGPPSQLCSFEKLEYLRIQGCNKLTSLFSFSAAQSLLRLEHLSVWGCSKLKYIIVKEEKNENNAVEKEILPNLKTIQINYCHELECIFPIPMARTLISLQEIEITDCSKLKHIIINEGENAMHNSSPLMFPRLKHIFVSGCDELDFHHPNLELRQPSSNMESMFSWQMPVSQGHRSC